MGLVDGAAQPLGADVGVDLRGGERGVAQEVLDAAQVGAALDQMGRGAVAQGVVGILVLTKGRGNFFISSI